MNKDKPDNPKAFPSMDMNSYHGVDRLELRYEGMTLRDYFAAKAMQAMISSYAMSDTYYKEIPFAAYKMADAMLEERSK